MAIKLNQSDIDFVQAAGIDKIKTAAYHFVRTKLVNGELVPNRGHPVFKAMGAIGADNREHLEEYFDISQNKKMEESQVDIVVENIMGWIRGELTQSGKLQAKIVKF